MILKLGPLGDAVGAGSSKSRSPAPATAAAALIANLRRFSSRMPLPPAKKRKVAPEQHDGLAHIQRLEKLLLTAVSERTSLNPLVDLLDAARDAGDPHILFKSIYALYRVFASVIDTGMLVPTPDTGVKAVRTWIWERLNVFTDMLVGLMSDSEKSLRVSLVQ